MKTRILVVGKYINKSTYVLYNEDGTEYKVIREGEEFKIGNQLRPWYPVLVPKKSGRGTILLCQKYGDKGNVIEEFPLIHNKRGLWAVTSGAARNGVFHNYVEPKTEIEKQLAQMGLSSRIIEKVDSIEVELELGGQLCHHVPNKRGYWCISDGDMIDLTEPSYAPRDHFNIYHRGCMESTYISKVTGGTYVIYYQISTTMNGSIRQVVTRVIITPEVKEELVVKELKELK